MVFVWISLLTIAIHAIKRVAAVRLAEKLGLVEDRDYTIEGIPRNVEGAQQLWERDKYPLGATKERNFKREMARAGRISIRGREFPTIQLLTAEELLEGKRFDTPPVLGRQQKAQQQLVF